MNAVRMMFRATESYYARLNRAKQADDLRKCRCWFDCRDEDVTVTLDNQGIALEYGKKTNRAAWPALIRVTELRDGLLLRLTERRLLFLPAGADDEALIAAGILRGGSAGLPSAPPGPGCGVYPLAVGWLTIPVPDSGSIWGCSLCGCSCCC